jgi:hypothetical protein
LSAAAYACTPEQFDLVLNRAREELARLVDLQRQRLSEEDIEELSMIEYLPSDMTQPEEIREQLPHLTLEYLDLIECQLRWQRDHDPAVVPRLVDLVSAGELDVAANALVVLAGLPHGVVSSEHALGIWQGATLRRHPDIHYYGAISAALHGAPPAREAFVSYLVGDNDAYRWRAVHVLLEQLSSDDDRAIKLLEDAAAAEGDKSALSVVLQVLLPGLAERADDESWRRFADQLGL